MAASAQVTDHDFGDDRDPLLVRPFVLQDSESPDDDPSTQTWPSATTREVRSRHAAGDEQATQVIPRLTPPRRFRRRLLVVGGVGAAVVLAAAAAAFAALRPEVSPSVASGAADAALPVVTGPAPSAPASAATTTGSGSATTHSAHHPTSASVKASATASASGGTPSAAPGIGSASSTGTAGTTAAPGGAQAHNLTPASERTGVIRGQNGLCLDLTGGLAFDDNRIQVFDCNGTTAQVWTLATDGTLRVDGKCALLVGDNSVHIVSCDGRTTAQWHASNSTLINNADNNCLTDPSGGRLSGTPVVVTTCGGSAGQRWSLP
jgi:hypothetical protein